MTDARTGLPPLPEEEKDFRTGAMLVVQRIMAIPAMTAQPLLFKPRGFDSALIVQQLAHSLDF